MRRWKVLKRRTKKAFQNPLLKTSRQTKQRRKAKEDSVEGNKAGER